MKRFFLSSLLLLSPMVWADAKSDLQQHLRQITSFDAQFSQVVTDEQNNTLQEAKGSLQLQQPNQLRWQQTAPEETLLITSGAQTYYFDSFAEQVTIMDTQSLINSTPFVLLTHHQDEQLWLNYSVVENKGVFELTPIEDEQSQVKRLDIVFDKQAQGFARISILDATGQQTQFTFKDSKLNQPLQSSLFEFVLPEGVAVDDQTQGE
ncbi:outer membrane lipoprotein carrier protein [Pseudoalteromonas ulvae UL12]|uniref:outer membrane lipoprotein chaperone LolA n=1 Tax=Pseudoalteromonas ulvae TaxID=107327 RepID=UPI00186B5D85|nr:outer membrane lipoprotein chaperone LolA [Pseudoalteromonas ulvae]MBE0364158.1 outer membrane lipoprotein carrier protein [Pseudoalteromonas ulvae UL12]